MNLLELFKDKTLKPKEKTELLSKAIIENKLTIDELINFAASSKDVTKATCIESLEFSTKQKPDILTRKAFQFVTTSLTEKTPRIKWESAKVIGNTVHIFQKDLEKPIKNLLDNSEHEGTVVRWSAAFALGEIVKLKTNYNKILLPAIEFIIAREEKNSIKKIYLDAIKKATK